MLYGARRSTASDVGQAGASAPSFALRAATLYGWLRVVAALGAAFTCRLGLLARRPEGSRPQVHDPMKLLGCVIAVVLALSIPIGYGIIGYLKEGDTLTYKAELTAARAAQYIYAPEAPWRYDTDQLAAISEIRTKASAPIMQRILDQDGAVMMRRGDLLGWPTFARYSPVMASGAQVGTAEVSSSMRPLLMEVAFVALGSVILAVAGYFAFVRLPLGALDRTLGELEASNARFRQQNSLLDTALETMAQGLIMYDADGRVVIANDRYAQLCGIDPAQLKPGITLREIVELRMANGAYPGRTADEVYGNIWQRLNRNVMTSVTNRMADGRAIIATIRPRADGGWVITHSDVSEHEALTQKLASQNELLIQREEELEKQNTRFNAAINHMSQGMCLFDAQQRVVFANQRYAEIYGLTPAQIKPGTSLREILKARVANGAYCESDIRKVVEDGVASFQEEVSEVLRLADGRFISVLRRPTASGGVVSTHEDVTVRERLAGRLSEQNNLLRHHEEELKAQNVRFDAALSNMSHGICMFDAEQRVLVANARYAEIYGLRPDQVKPGTTLRQIVEARIAKGLYAGPNPEEYIRERLAAFHDASVAVHHLSDGRAICVRRQPMRAGGWVTTHEDITEREKLKVRLEQQNEQLDAAMNNMAQGLAMYDDQQRLVICNKRYAEMYGLTREQVRPGTTVREILRHRMANGCYVPSQPQQHADRLLTQFGKIDSEIQELADGRSIVVSHHRTPNGAHVVTHQDITDQRRSEAKIVHMALHDALTDLPNRVLLNERLEGALARVRRGETLAVHLLDLDHFKTVNDTLGHPTGDKLLKMVAARLRALVRETDTVARMGGDEFAILQAGISQPADATALALRVIQSVSAPYELDGIPVVIGTSVGIAVGPADGTAPDQLIRNADLALYRAKGDGRSTYRFFSSEMDAQMQVRRTMEHDLRKALAAGEFELHYQPVVNLGSGEISGVEALIRWRHPQNGLVPPATFIPVAEEIGFIIQLGEWALREACRAAAAWPEHVKIAVNLSPIQFRSPGFVSIVVGALAASGLSADRLELEITEGMLVQDSEGTLDTLFQLRGLGVRIAMDDFGTGYSSLSYLQSFPFDKIKIDRSFVKDIAEGAGSLNIVRAVAAMANGLGMTTTAEGVETKEQLDTVRAEGCTEMQGFLFSKPLPIDELERLIAEKCAPRPTETVCAA